MRISILMLLICLISCASDPECKNCATVSYSDRLLQAGLANDGFEEEDRIELGEFCDDQLNAIPQGLIDETTIFTTNYNYTLRVYTECD